MGMIGVFWVPLLDETREALELWICELTDSY